MSFAVCEIAVAMKILESLPAISSNIYLRGQTRFSKGALHQKHIVLVIFNHEHDWFHSALLLLS
jgi:hypothetical protein